MSERAQFNVRIPKNIKRRVALERVNTLASQDIIVEVAMESWFTKFSPQQRRQFYLAHDRRPYARVKPSFKEVSARADAAYAYEVSGLKPKV